MRLFKLSLRPSQSHTFFQPIETLFDVDPPTFVGCSLYSIIKALLLQTWTLAAESTSQQLSQSPSTTRILDYQLSISDAIFVLAPATFFRFRLDPCGLIFLSGYLDRRSRYKTQQRSMKCVVKSQLIYFCVVHMPCNTRSHCTLIARALVVVLLAISWLLPLLISAYRMIWNIVFYKSLVLSFQVVLIAKTNTK